MKESIIEFAESAKNFAYLIPAFIGGVVDFMNQVQRGDKRWSLFGFASHMLSAVFFGWFAGAVAFEFGYSPNMIAASGGLGGFLGVRLADLVISRFLKIDRRAS